MCLMARAKWGPPRSERICNLPERFVINIHAKINEHMTIHSRSSPSGDKRGTYQDVFTVPRDITDVKFRFISFIKKLKGNKIDF